MSVKRFFTILLLTVVLCGCHFNQWVYHPVIRQGNVLTNMSAQAIKVGMTPDQVQQTLGSPVFTNIFSTNELVYIYTIQPPYRSMQQSYLIIYFTAGQVSHFTTNLKPEVIKPH